MFKKLILPFLLFITSLQLYAFDVKVTASDTLPKINTGMAYVTVTGGQAPFEYYWKDSKGTARDADTCRGIVEGRPNTVIVIDANNDSVTKTFTIPTSNSSEFLNSSFIPLVNGMYSFLFWDPFAAMNMYDNNVYVPNKTYFTNGGVVTRYLDTIDLNENPTYKPFYIDANRDTVFVTAEALTGGKESNLYALAQYENDSTFYIEDQYATQQFHANGDEKKREIPFIVIWLVFGALFFTIRMGFINIRGFKHAIQLVQGKFDNPNHKEAGEVTHFQALVTALSGTVGTGNIAGVAIAIAIGGPGATFWMIVAGLIGMSAKFVECTLGVKYRSVNEDGEVSGGPMYYLSRVLAKRNLKVLGKVLAGVFAILCVGASFGGGNMFQSNIAYSQIENKFEVMKEFSFMGLNGGAFVGIIMAIIVGIVIIGGIKSIAKITDKIVPLMVGIYVLTALYIIVLNIGEIGHAFSIIVEGAFSPDATKGGILGVLILGFRRAAFSNEAGVGSASIAHSAAKTDQPVSEGFVSLLEPFIDTVVVCTMTALVLIFTGYAEDTQGLTAAPLSSAAFTSVISWFDWVLVIALILFAFSTMISWSYYGLKSWGYLFGEHKVTGYIYKFIFLLCVVIGASTGLGAVLDFSDLMILGMALPNIIGLLIMSGEVRHDLSQYLADIKSGVIKKFK